LIVRIVLCSNLFIGHCCGQMAGKSRLNQG
jgi:hypothetical protein